MKNHRTGFFVIVLLGLSLVLVLAACQEEDTGPDEDILLQDPNYIMGAGLYRRHCLGCHGEGGEGRTSLGPPLNEPEWQDTATDDHIREVILEGRRVAGTSMDSFEGVVSDSEIDALIVYIRTFR
jgi:mono/diheme cytochrome c family protein